MSFLIFSTRRVGFFFFSTLPVFLPVLRPFFGRLADEKRCSTAQRARCAQAGEGIGGHVTAEESRAAGRMCVARCVLVRRQTGCVQHLLLLDACVRSRAKHVTAVRFRWKDLAAGENNAMR